MDACWVKMNAVEEEGGHAGSTYGTGSHHIDATAIPDSRIIRWHLDGIAGRSHLAALLAIDAIPALRTHRWYGMIQIVIEKLSPLHHHVGDPGVRCDLLGGH